VHVRGLTRGYANPGHGPGDVFSIRDLCPRLQSNVTNGEDLSGTVSELKDSCLNIILTADNYVASQQFVNVIMFNDLKFRE